MILMTDYRLFRSQRTSRSGGQFAGWQKVGGAAPCRSKAITTDGGNCHAAPDDHDDAQENLW